MWEPEAIHEGSSHGGAFHVPAAGCVRHLLARDIEWYAKDGTPVQLDPVLPTARIAPIAPMHCASGAVQAAWGRGRHGQAWKVVPDVRWSLAESITWHVHPATLPPHRQKELVDASVHGAALLDAPLAVWTCAGLRELWGHAPAPGSDASAPGDSAAAPWSWKAIFSLHTPEMPAALLTFTTNGQMDPLLALQAASRVLVLDTHAVTEAAASSSGTMVGHRV